MCLSVVPSTAVFAETGEPETEVGTQSDTDQIPYVDDIDEYLEQLNAGLISPSQNTVITTYESTITPFELAASVTKLNSLLYTRHQFPLSPALRIWQAIFS